jgi:hypothetical protein
VVLLLFCQQSAKAALNINDASKALYEFRFQDADSIITKLENEYPDHFLPALARSQYHWWRIISQKDSPTLRKTISKPETGRRKDATPFKRKRSE